MSDTLKEPEVIEAITPSEAEGVSSFQNALRRFNRGHKDRHESTNVQGKSLYVKLKSANLKGKSRSA